MPNPKTVGRFYVDTTGQAARATASAQEAAVNYLDELAGIGRTYIGIWSSAQQLSLQTAFHLQNSVIEANRALWDSSTKANVSLFEEWAKAVVAGQAATAGLTAAAVDMLKSATPDRVK